MGQFRDLMERDMKIRGFSSCTRDAYLRGVRDFIRYFMRSPDKLTCKDINRYQLYLIEERKVSLSYFNQIVAAIRFFYLTSLNKQWNVNQIPYQRTHRRLPEVLSRKEIDSLFNSVTNIKHLALLMTIYSAGLRVSEAVNLRISDIDSQRMVIRIEQGKGFKDRYVMLAKRLLPVLSKYKEKYKPSHWLFPGQDPSRHLNQRGTQAFFAKYKKAANISKSATVHSLRHSFATHLLEDGVNIRVIQGLLGHKSLSSTVIYTHVAKSDLVKVRSPLDRKHSR